MGKNSDSKPDDECQHEFKKFKQTIMPERNDYQVLHGMNYTKGNAYFIVRACIKCKKKEYVDMTVEE